MSKRKEEPSVPPTDEPVKPDEASESAPKPADEKPLDPKEIARERSKEDLARKRRDLHRHGRH